MFRPNSEFYNSQDSLGARVNGMGRFMNNYQLEGVDNNFDNGVAVYPAPWSGASQWQQNNSVVFRFTLTIDGNTPTYTPLTTGSHSWVWEARG